MYVFSHFYQLRHEAKTKGKRMRVTRTSMERTSVRRRLRDTSMAHCQRQPTQRSHWRSFTTLAQSGIRMRYVFSCLR
jgi:hypothetical protein